MEQSSCNSPGAGKWFPRSTAGTILPRLETGNSEEALFLPTVKQVEIPLTFDKQLVLCFLPGEGAGIGGKVDCIVINGITIFLSLSTLSVDLL